MKKLVTSYYLVQIRVITNIGGCDVAGPDDRGDLGHLTESVGVEVRPQPPVRDCLEHKRLEHVRRAYVGIDFFEAQTR